MKSNNRVQMNPTVLSDTDLRTVVFHVIGEVNRFCVIDKPMTREEAAAFVKYGVNAFDKYVAKGKFRAMRIDAKADPRFLPSMLIEDLKALSRS